MTKCGHEDRAECLAEARADATFKASSYAQEYDTPCDIPEDILRNNLKACANILDHSEKFPRADFEAVGRNHEFLSLRAFRLELSRPVSLREVRHA